MVWGGLRGAVGLALALIASRNVDIDETFEIQNKVGIAFTPDVYPFPSL